MWALVQYDNRVLDSQLRRLVKRNRSYCLKHGYEYIFEKKSYDLPPWWRKVEIVRTLLESGKYEGVMWLDTDAAVHDCNSRIEDFLIEGKSFYYSSDPPIWDSEFNAGVWIVVNDPKGRAIMKKWMASYSPKDWTKKGNKWETSGGWAGSTYEQGSFKKYIRPKFKKFIHKFPWELIQSHNPNSNTFIVHFSGDYSKTHLPKYRTTRKKRC
jgi:hypothetical protein